MSNRCSVGRAVVAWMSLSIASLSPAMAQPNVVFIISDDAGWADFGFNDQGNGQIPTPALDSIANRGRWFRAAYTAPVCSPSRARIFLGQHNQRTGYDNNNPDSLSAADPVVEGLTLGDTTMFERMRDRGYHVGFFGKWHLGTELDVVSNGQLVTPGNLPPRHGIDYFWGLTSGSRSYFINDTSGYSRLLREQTLDAGTNLVVDTVVESDYPSGGYLTDILAEEVADYITDRAAQPGPFFAVASFTAPHGPLQATQEYFDRADALGLGLTGNRRTYAAMMIAFDDGVRTILDRLEDPNNDGMTGDSILDSTLVCFINDNGGETANSARNFPLRGKKSDTFDGGIRVMLAMAGPGIPATGASFDHPVDSVDLTPTFLAATGTPIAPDDFTDGVNLLPYLDGTLGGAPRADLFIRGNNPITAGAREGDFKLTIENIGGPFLYDIVANPAENNVRNADFPAVVERMTDIMNGFEAEYMKPRWGVTDANPFDGFVWNAAAVSSGLWSAPGAWSAEGGSPASARMYPRDGYANMTARFPSRDTAYTATNDLGRPDGLPLIGNRLAFDGVHSAMNTSRATIAGSALMLADTLEGVAPRLTQDTTSTGGAHPATVAIELRLWDDLIVDGAGTQPLELAGGVVEERAGRSVAKISAGPLEIVSAVRLSGPFTLMAGSTAIRGDGNVAAGPLLVADGATLALGDGAGRGEPDHIDNRRPLSIETPNARSAPVTLAFEGTEIIGALLVDGQPLPQGTYSAETHPALLQGPGLLRIRGPLECAGDVNEDGFADIDDTIRYLDTFDADVGCGQGSVPLVAGITVNTVASADTPGNASCQVTAPGTDLGRGWTFGSSQTPVAAGAGAPGGISLAYAFPGAAATGPDYEDPSRTSSTIEIWVRPDDLSGEQIIWEAGGGSRGAALWLAGDELRLDVQNGSPAPVRATTTLSPGWHQIVVVIDITNSTSRLYVDGMPRDAANLGSMDRWAGGNPSGLGTVASTAVGSITPPDFRGRIAIYRAYNANRVLSDAEVLDSFNAVFTASDPCDGALDLNSDGVLTGEDVLIHLLNLEACGG
ncbi:MAG: sulfatase-like hydrolase/transferase [Planctomycetota bacterium]